MAEEIIKQQETTNIEPELKGLGGWLVLIGIGLILAPIKLGYFLYSTYNEIFSSGVWELLTAKGNEYYQEYFAELLIAERSEERRVGKECRLRWSPILHKKKTRSQRSQKFRP